MTLDFSVVRFTPDPEDVEPVNAALVFWQRPPLLVFDPKFPRLACLSEYVDPELVQFYLEDFATRLRSGVMGTEAALPQETSTSSQFQLTSPRRLVAPLSDRTIEMLKEKFLRKHRPHRVEEAMSVRETDARERVRVESVLDALLVDRLHVPSRDLMRQASPRDFLSERVFDRLGGNGFKVARAIIGPKDLVLIDGVNLGQRNFQKAEIRAQQVAGNFFKVEKVRDDLERLEGRRLQTATVLFGQHAPKYESKHEFLKTMLEKFSNEVIDPEHPTTEFRHALQRATVPVL
jgi:hypothetical protein